MQKHKPNVLKLMQYLKHIKVNKYFLNSTHFIDIFKYVIYLFLNISNFKSKVWIKKKNKDTLNKHDFQSVKCLKYAKCLKPS